MVKINGQLTKWLVIKRKCWGKFVHPKL